jgi:hypothetical protein
MRITSLLEFEYYFGDDSQHQFDINLTKRGQVVDVSRAIKRFCLSQSSHNFLLYRSLQLFFTMAAGRVRSYRWVIIETLLMSLQF